MKVVSLFITLSFIISCKNDKPETVSGKNVAKVEIFNQQDFEEKVEIIDTFCIAETRRAKDDIKNGKIVLSADNFHELHGLNLYNQSKLIIQELRKYKISFDSIPHLHTCIRHHGDQFFNPGCYDDVMRNEIEDRYGKNFLDSLTTVLQKKYIASIPDKIFMFHESDRPRDGDLGSPAYDFIQKMSFDIQPQITYPPGYAYKSGDHSGASAIFVLMKDGTVKNIEMDINFLIPQNKKFHDYFEKQFKELITKTKWRHPTFAGIVSNCEMHFYFDFK